MFGTRIHGRGGQGVVTAAELLSVAAFDSGRHAQAFPSFGSERTGAPVVAYCRVSENPIRTREPIVAPDALVVCDASLLGLPEVLTGLTDGGSVLINSELPADRWPVAADDVRVVTVPATQIAMHRIGRPVPNVVLLGGFAALTGVVTLPALEEALADRFSGALLEGNRQAARDAYEAVGPREVSDALAD